MLTLFFLIDIIITGTTTREEKRAGLLSWTAIMQPLLCDSIKQQGQGLDAGELTAVWLHYLLV